LQRVLVAPGVVHHLGHLGLGDLEREYADHGEALAVDGQHDLDGVVMVDAEKAFEHVHHEFHRRVIVVQQQNLVERRPLGLRPRLGDDAALSLGSVVVRCWHT
jgi:hypothetical protein